ncbi:MAG: TPM domain-containing protein [Nanoarchaeota archaeon]
MKKLIVLIVELKILVYILIGLIVLNSATAYLQLDGYVNDFANLLSPQQEAELNNLIGLVEKNTSVQIAVVLVANTEGHDTSEYATAIGEQNGVGRADIDNGVVILWSLDDMKGGCIATGRGIEHILTDAEVSRIGRAARSQFIDNGDYFNGMTFIVQEVYKELQRSEVTNISSTSSLPFGIPLLLILLIGIFILVFIIGKSSHDDDNDDTPMRSTTTPYIPYTNRKSRKRDSSDYSSLAAASYISSKSSYDDDDNDSFSSGGFGGFGGGSFGGGGGRF